MAAIKNERIKNLKSSFLYNGILFPELNMLGVKEIAIFDAIN